MTVISCINSIGDELYEMKFIKLQPQGRVLASYTSQTRDQKRFTVSEVAADWHELMIPQHTMRPSIALVSEQLDPQLQLADTPPSQPATLGLHPVARKRLFISCPVEGRRLS